MQSIFRIGQVTLGLSLGLILCVFTGVETLPAQDFPTRPINLVIPYGAGGASDLTARAFINTAKQHLGQPIVIQIRAGGGGAIGSESVAQAKPDGHTLLLGHTNCNTVMPAVQKRSKGPDELATVAMVGTSDSVYWVQSSSSFKTIEDVIVWAKANPDKLTFGCAGAWGVTDFGWRWLERKAGFTSRNTPYPGGAEALVALLGGHIQITRLSLPQSLPHMRAGTIRPIAIPALKRDPDLPNVQTMQEAGYDIGLGGSWKGVLAPKGTPRPIIDKLAAGFKKMMDEKAAVAALKQLGDTFDYKGPAEFEKHWREEFKIYTELGQMFKGEK
jgi:tripartite-type tricarboxylate transporter receptor subunit TctC